MWLVEIRRAAPQRTVNTLVAAFGHVDQHAGFKNFVVQPLAEVLGDDRREEGVVFAGANIGDTAFHGLLGLYPVEMKAICALLLN